MNIRLEGCRTKPLGSYLKAMGIFRLLAEKVSVLAWWEGDVFNLQSPLTLDELKIFFLSEYQPSSILSPWNSGSIFKNVRPKQLASREASKPKPAAELNWLLNNADPRLDTLRSDACKIIEIIKNEKGKEAVVRKCRNMLSDSAVEWMDVVWAVDAKDQAGHLALPIAGSGGNDGNLELSSQFVKALITIFDHIKESSVRELFDSSLTGVALRADEFVGMLKEAKIGFYDPVGAGGINQLSSPWQDAKDVTPVNPWDIILMFEGLLMFSGSISSRNGVKRASSPFTVGLDLTGFHQKASDKKAKVVYEVWAPVWGNPATYAEIRKIIREGRSDFERHTASSTNEFFHAASTLGVDSGISHFQRHVILKKRGEAHIAAPLGKAFVRKMPQAESIREIIPFLNELSENLDALPHGLSAAVTRLSGAVQNYYSNPKVGVTRILESLGIVVKHLMNGPAVLHGTDRRVPRRLPRLDAGKWVELVKSEGRVEPRLAAALASVSHKKPIIEDLLNLENGSLKKGPGKRSFAGADLPSKIVTLFLPKIIETIREGNEENHDEHLRGRFQVDVCDVVPFLMGETDDGLLERLFLGLTCLDWRNLARNVLSEPLQSRPVPLTFVLLKSVFQDYKTPDSDFAVHPSVDLPYLIYSGKVREAMNHIVIRLKTLGFDVPKFDPDQLDGKRLAASMFIPVTPQSYGKQARKFIQYKAPDN